MITLIHYFSEWIKGDKFKNLQGKVRVLKFAGQNENDHLNGHK